MAGEIAAVRISGLSRMDAFDLRERAGDEAATLEPEPVPEGHLGEPATIAVVLAVTAAALKAYTAYLAFKDRERQGRSETITHTIELVRADGTKERKTITYQAGAADMSAAALSALSTVPGLETVLGAEAKG